MEPHEPLAQSPPVATHLVRTWRDVRARNLALADAVGGTRAWLSVHVFRLCGEGAHLWQCSHTCGFL